jgi:hypothetical protein
LDDVAGDKHLLGPEDGTGFKSNDGKFVARVSADQDLAGLVFGKGGNTKQRVEEETGAYVAGAYTRPLFGST